MSSHLWLKLIQILLLWLLVLKIIVLNPPVCAYLCSCCHTDHDMLTLPPCQRPILPCLGILPFSAINIPFPVMNMYVCERKLKQNTEIYSLNHQKVSWMAMMLMFTWTLLWPPGHAVDHIFNCFCGKINKDVITINIYAWIIRTLVIFSWFYDT